MFPIALINDGLLQHNIKLDVAFKCS